MLNGANVQNTYIDFTLNNLGIQAMQLKRGDDNRISNFVRNHTKYIDEFEWIEKSNIPVNYTRTII